MGITVREALPRRFCRVSVREHSPSVSIPPGEIFPVSFAPSGKDNLDIQIIMYYYSACNWWKIRACIHIFNCQIKCIIILHADPQPCLILEAWCPDAHQVQQYAASCNQAWALRVGIVHLKIPLTCVHACMHGHVEECPGSLNYIRGV